MKRLTEKKRHWFKIRALSQAKKHRPMLRTAIYTTDTGSQKVKVGNSRPLPQTLCLDRDLSSTILFFNKFRNETITPKYGFARRPSSKKRGNVKSLRNFYDFETLKFVSPGAALILAAEFDRVNEVSKQRPTSINIGSWNDLVYSTFFHLGFFKLLGFSEARVRNQSIARPPILSDLSIMQMQSGYNTDVEQAAKAVKNLFESIGANNETAVKLISAIVDAIENVVGHAYQNLPTGLRKRIPFKWWIGGSADAASKTVTIYVYDQGITIPVSLPLVWNKDRAFAAVMAKFGVGPWKDAQDGEAIQAAMLLSTTSTGISSRGKGLHKIKEIVSQIDGGVLTILSRRGYYRWQDSQEHCVAMESALMGTYVELKAKFETN